MSDITYTNVATELRNVQGLVTGPGDAGTLKLLGSATIELAASTANDTVKFCRIPASARISSISLVSWDDLASTGAPTLDMGLGTVDGNITSDPVALSNGHDVTAAGSSAIVGDIANYNKKAWELVSGQSTDPSGFLDVYGTIVDASTNIAATVTVEVYGYLD